MSTGIIRTRRPRRTWDETRREIARYHEAGHAVIAIRQGIPVTYVEISKDGFTGCVEMEFPPGMDDTSNGFPPPDSFDGWPELYDALLPAIKTLCAGSIAAHIHEDGRTSKLFTLGFDGMDDNRRAQNLVNVVITEESRRRPYLQRIRRDVSKALRRPKIWAEVVAVAEALRTQKLMLPNELHNIMISASP